MRITKYGTIVCIIVFSLLLGFSSCGSEYDAETVSDISVLNTGDDPYDLTCLQVAEMLDEYIYVKKARCNRGTDKYVEFLDKTANKDPELQALPEWPAIEIYIKGYRNPTGSIKDIELDDDGLMPDMTDMTIREYVEYSQGDDILPTD